MIHFPHSPARRSAGAAGYSPSPARPAITRDILWNQPVFKAPTLAVPCPPTEPLPFLAGRLTRRARRS